MRAKPGREVFEALSVKKLAALVAFLVECRIDVAFKADAASVWGFVGEGFIVVWVGVRQVDNTGVFILIMRDKYVSIKLASKKKERVLVIHRLIMASRNAAAVALHVSQARISLLRGKPSLSLLPERLRLCVAVTKKIWAVALSLMLMVWASIEFDLESECDFCRRTEMVETKADKVCGRQSDLDNQQRNEQAEMIEVAIIILVLAVPDHNEYSCFFRSGMHTQLQATLAIKAAMQGPEAIFRSELGEHWPNFDHSNMASSPDPVRSSRSLTDVHQARVAFRQDVQAAARYRSFMDVDDHEPWGWRMMIIERERESASTIDVGESSRYVLLSIGGPVGLQLPLIATWGYKKLVGGSKMPRFWNSQRFSIIDYFDFDTIIILRMMKSLMRRHRIR
ncbi:uncharacterized protein MYCFIDRAFT_180399 [Pseudocercospora fijiensis CIRAD86]|uniref:Uncharacterized protein n=1 Tax=Pseudocercospora fijiensis (strain CIRAD86) TaxID=383855 RepID=M2YGX2_PSEFD|nr:uncharacterized protein MYCFIDRAFT_180399 [Pseudocercospora fijiensis CIRAD86]EME77065.1 hypothetical protein MYCFIDRAFT_180399 [Pseudocercospora fijiensis CIRAD86]